MKKYIGILLIICMVFCLTACGKTDKEQEQPTEEIATEESVASTELMSSTEKVSVSEIEKPSTQSAYSLDWDAEDAYLLAKIAMAEAEGEDTEGKALVIRVVLNRVWSDSFPGHTIVEVKNGWGKLKSGAGWISLAFTKKVGQ